MSKGNMLLGYARGKVGSLVFARRKGEQITRARNTAPTNPRTRSQLGQRMKMYAPVKFYRQSLERFFKYAFSVGSHETVFNAFMRENIGIAPWTAKPLVTQQAPVPYPARMSSGGVGALPVVVVDEYSSTLPIGTVEVVESGNVITMNLGGIFGGSIGAASLSLTQNGTGLKEGDQLTFVVVGTKGLSLQGNDVSYNNTDGFEFIYKAFVLDTSSTVLLEDIGFTVGTEGTGISLALPFTGENVAFGGCVIVTRSNGGKIDASNTSLTLNAYATSIYEKMRSEEYRALAELSYKASADAVLDPITTAEGQNA